MSRRLDIKDHEKKKERKKERGVENMKNINKRICIKQKYDVMLSSHIITDSDYRSFFYHDISLRVN